MIFTRNPTPRAFAFVGSALISVVLAMALAIFVIALKINIAWYTIALLSVVVGALSYLVIYLLLERFIYRKIKLIYKTIHDLKLSKDDEADRVQLSEDIISEVSDEVQKWANAQNKEIARLKDQEEYRKEFIGNVFHEIKTPVFSIQGYLHTLRDGAFDDKNVNKVYLKKAVKNVDRLEKIIEDLELIALQESDQLEIKVEKFDVTQLIKDVFDALELQADERDMEFGIKEGCDKPFNVLADRDKIRQVVFNLVNNAIKYGKEGGQCLVGLYDMDVTVLVEISDDGQGIEPEELNRLFERFYRADKSRYRESTGGTGLGLAIVKHIMDAHDQTISVRSKVGEGSTFGFTLKKG